MCGKAQSLRSGQQCSFRGILSWWSLEGTAAETCPLHFRERAPCAPIGVCQLSSQVDTDLVGGHPAGRVFLILVDRRPERGALWAPGGRGRVFPSGRSSDAPATA